MPLLFNVDPAHLMIAACPAFDQLSPTPRIYRAVSSSSYAVIIYLNYGSWDRRVVSSVRLSICRHQRWTVIA
jgi:hypothetical protein